MNWNDVKYFHRWSFSEDGNKASPALIQALDKGRRVIGQRMWPSPVKGALARQGGSPTSQHYIGDGIRKSTGSDIFAEGIPMENFLMLYHTGLFGGMGIYLDTTGPDGLPWVMLHLDIREIPDGGRPLVWFRHKVSGKAIYAYPHRDPKALTCFRDGRMYINRTMKRKIL